MDTEKRTLGSAAVELLAKPHESINVLDLQKDSEKDFLKKMENIIETHGDYAENYYIQVLNLQENSHRKWLPNVFTRKLIPRFTPPEVSYDTSLFSYNNRKEELLFHWSIPDANTCFYLMEHETELDKTDRDFFHQIQKHAPHLIKSLSDCAKRFKNSSLISA